MLLYFGENLHNCDFCGNHTCGKNVAQKGFFFKTSLSHLYYKKKLKIWYEWQNFFLEKRSKETYVSSYGKKSFLVWFFLAINLL